MLFNSIEFGVFLPLVFAGYWFLFSKRLHARNIFLLVTSYFFYGWWDWRFLFLLAFTSSVDYLTALYLSRTENNKKRKLLLAITLICNLTVLGFFKYCNFFTDTFLVFLSNFHIHADVPALKIILPVGISFYTFQSIAYVTDVYRKRINACSNYITFMAFVSFFPQLVAGPISRARNLLTQFYSIRKFDYPLAITGLRFILYGLLKKVVIADNLARLVDEVYNHSADYSGITTATATLFFAVQIYCDFSGYSDIALGVSRLFGFDLMQNFSTPYFATSIREFWQRWHISLSTWFRDYFYIPLGGNRVSESRKYFNLLLTFLVSGFWHGANWTFVIWGGIHGSALVLEEFLKARIRISVPAFVRWLITFLIVCFAWIFFRSKSLHDALAIINQLPYGWSIGALFSLFAKVYISQAFVFILLSVTGLFLLTELNLSGQFIDSLFERIPGPVRLGIYYSMIVLILIVGLNDSAPNFIYFKF